MLEASSWLSFPKTRQWFRYDLPHSWFRALAHLEISTSWRHQLHRVRVLSKCFRGRLNPTAEFLWSAATPEQSSALDVFPAGMSNHWTRIFSMTAYDRDLKPNWSKWSGVPAGMFSVQCGSKVSLLACAKQIAHTWCMITSKAPHVVVQPKYRPFCQNPVLKSARRAKKAKIHKSVLSKPILPEPVNESMN